MKRQEIVIFLVVLLLNCLPITTFSAMAQRLQCEDSSVSTRSLCEQVEIKNRSDRHSNPARQCESKYKDGGKPTQDELAKILESHAEWLSVYAGQPSSQKASKDPRRANLCGADLRALNLQGVDLRRADLQEANLPWNLTGIVLEEADLTRANFSMTNLQNARLGGAFTTFTNFCGTKLRGADLNTNLTILVRASIHDTALNLQGVNLCGASLSKLNLQRDQIVTSYFNSALLMDVDLSGATLTGIDLSKARLEDVNLRGATLIDVDLSQTFLGLKDAEGLQIIGAKGLSSVTFRNPATMVTLRKFLKESGLRNEEKAVTSALRKFALQTEPSYVWVFETIVLGGWITDYGAQSWWSLIFLIAGIPVFSLPYMLALSTRGQAGIWAISPPDHTYMGQKSKVERVTRTFLCPTLHLWSDRRWRTRVWRWVRVPWTGIYFSLLSAFNIGWRDLSVGTWITRLQPREYTLRATGWVRVISGLQSLLSVYFLALWALTYFGRPFE